MRKFSNKSKKEKKNAIRRKTKDNRRNNKRRTYRKKMKGGDTHPAAQRVNNLVNKLETNVNELIEVIDNIPEEKANIFFNNVEEIKEAYQNLNRALRIVKNSLKELSEDKGSCGWPWNKDQDCEESKKNSYINAVKAINKIPELQKTARKKLTALKALNNIDSTPNNAIELLKRYIIEVIDITTTSEEEKNIEAIKKKATSRGAQEKDFNIKNQDTDGNDDDEELDITKIHTYNGTVQTTENPYL